MSDRLFLTVLSENGPVWFWKWTTFENRVAQQKSCKCEFKTISFNPTPLMGKNLEIILMKNNYFLWFSRNVLYLLHKSFDSHARKFPSHCPFCKPIIPFKLLFLYLAADVSSWISLVGKLTGRLIPNILQSVVLAYGTDCSCIKKETCLPRSWIQVVRWLKWRDRGMLETSKEGCDAGFLFCFLKPA